MEVNIYDKRYKNVVVGQKFTSKDKVSLKSTFFHNCIFDGVEFDKNEDSSFAFCRFVGSCPDVV